MIYSGRTPYGTNQVESSSLAITVENTDVAVFTTGSLLVSGSLTSLGGFTGSFSGSFTGSANLTAFTASNALVTGNVIVLGTASINTLVVNQTQYTSGSNQLGDGPEDVQTLYGTVRIPTGSLTVTGSTIISSSVATQLQVGNNFLFISSSGNVGIGTSTPAYNLDVITPTGSTTIFRAINPGAGASIHRGGGILVTMLNTQTTGGRTRINQYDTSGYGGSNFIEFVGGTGALTTEGSTYIQGLYEVGLGVGGTKRLSADTSGVRVIGTFNASGVSAFASNVTITGSATNSLLVKGSGATSATTTLRVENSSANSSLTVLDNGFVGIGVSSPNFRLDVSGSSEFIGNIQVTGSTFISASASTSSAALQVYKSGSTVLNVEGSSGQLFSITDSLTGSLFSVNTVAGLPVIEAFSDNTVNIGKFGVYPIKVAATGTLAVITGSLLGTASLATTALTASYVNPLTQSVFISGSLTITGSSTDTLFQVGAASTSSIFRVSGSGNVVIGSGSVFDSRLTITGPSNYNGSLLTLIQTIPSESIRFQMVQNGIETAQFGVTGTTNSYILGAPTTADFGLRAVNNIIFSTTNGISVQMTLQKTTGNLGIGTTNPSTRLHVKGSGATSSTTSFRVENSAATARLTILDDGTSAFNTNNLYISSSGNIGIGTSSPTSRLFVNGNTYLSGSASTGSALTVYKSGSTVVSIQGSQGELFSITDSLSGSLFSVSNISGLPILEVFSDNTTLMGNYLAPSLNTTQVVTANSGSTNIYSLPTASYDGAFYDYVVRSGSNSRAGQIMAIWSGSSVNYTDNSTTDFGSTANLSFNVIVSGSNMVLRSTVTTGSWTVKTIIRSI